MTRWTTADLKQHQAKQPKPAKYHNQEKVVDGIIFKSLREADRYIVLRNLEKAGEIQDLKLQYVYAIVIDGVRICDYICDFRYVRDGKTITEDAKGMRTAVFQIKKKLMLAVWGIEILET